MNCTDSTYIGFEVLATIGILAYPVGIPVLTLLALLRASKSILAEDEKTQDVYGFLIADYKPQFFFWDCLEMFRKVCITHNANIRLILREHFLKLFSKLNEVLRSRTVS